MLKKVLLVLLFPLFAAESINYEALKKRACLPPCVPNFLIDNIQEAQPAEIKAKATAQFVATRSWFVEQGKNMLVTSNDQQPTPGYNPAPIGGELVVPGWLSVLAGTTYNRQLWRHYQKSDLEARIQAVEIVFTDNMSAILDGNGQDIKAEEVSHIKLPYVLFKPLLREFRERKSEKKSLDKLEVQVFNIKSWLKRNVSGQGLTTSASDGDEILNALIHGGYGWLPLGVSYSQNRDTIAAIVSIAAEKDNWGKIAAGNDVRIVRGKNGELIVQRSHRGKYIAGTCFLAALGAGAWATQRGYISFNRASYVTFSPAVSVFLSTAKQSVFSLFSSAWGSGYGLFRNFSNLNIWRTK